MKRFLELVVSFLISLTGVLLTSGEMFPIRSNKAMHSRCDENMECGREKILCKPNAWYSILSRSLASVISSTDF
ncbi:hypothetical protein PsorP6_012285 [Peronosclerospora sorghi]|uniref:Uncharacterized protein n=1 Tax=Peronosclerospora sorghi TaxID=230839 RepID=A0ACC0WMJ6_9STRA|nr:hypothetical protein PsorP6_012285 [Peronosclerospora sorghi]